MTSLIRASGSHHIDAVFTSLDILGIEDVDCTNPTARPQKLPPLYVRGGMRIDKSLSIGGGLCMFPGAVITGDIDGNLLGDTFVFGNLIVSGMVIADDDIVTAFNLEGEQVVVSNVITVDVCANGTVFVDNIEPKHASVVTLPDIVVHDVIANDIFANSITIAGNSLSIALDDIVANSIVSNVIVVNTSLNVNGPLNGNVIFADEVCITGQIQVDTLSPKTGSNIDIMGGLTAGDIIARNVTAGNIIAANITFSGDTVIEGNIAAFNELNVTTSVTSNLVVGSTICVNDVLLANEIRPKSGNIVFIIADTFTNEFVAGNIIVQDIIAGNIVSTVVRANTVIANVISGNSPIQITDSLLPLRFPADPFKRIVLGDVGTNQIFDEIYGDYYFGIDGCFSGNVITHKILPKGNVLQLCGTVQADNIIANSITIAGNSLTANVDLTDITSNSITTNVLVVLDQVSGDLCVTGQVIVNELSPKTGSIITINGLIQADDIIANSIVINGNTLTANVDLTVITSNIITTNVLIVLDQVNSDLCVTGQVIVDELSPKTGNIITINGLLQAEDIIANSITISGNALNVDLDNIQSNVIQSNIINSTVIITNNFTSNTIITNVITSNTITANLITSNDVCVTGQVIVDELTPKTGNIITLNGNLNVDTVVAQTIQAQCIDYTRVVVNSATYMISTYDDIIGVKYTVIATPTITLPLISSLPHKRKQYIIVDEGGNASINGITIQPTAPDTIIGGNSVVLMGNYNSMTLYSDEDSEWFII